VPSLASVRNLAAGGILVGQLFAVATGSSGAASPVAQIPFREVTPIRRPIPRDVHEAREHAVTAYTARTSADSRHTFLDPNSALEEAVEMRLPHRTSSIFAPQWNESFFVDVLVTTHRAATFQQPDWAIQLPLWHDSQSSLQVFGQVSDQLLDSGARTVQQFADITAVLQIDAVRQSFIEVSKWNQPVFQVKKQAVLQTARKMVDAVTALDDSLQSLDIQNSDKDVNPSDAPALLTESTQAPATRQASAIETIKARTELSDIAIGELVSVSRVTVSNWKDGGRITGNHLEKLLHIESIIEIAHQYRPSVDRMRGWLYTPVTSRAVRPYDLLRNGEFDEARMLATIDLPRVDVAIDKSWWDLPLSKASVRREAALHSTIVDERSSFTDSDQDTDAE